ncbi:TetR/AcrR family transcriptional regulator [Streptomyces sp. DG2A-72]|uniref:TetR/AcrR family transcriptional regulator n=1 Tax=Streptomyces sp. DG2A-72 TaxID=3051386 RepID=UPI00265C2896|nr:TetR/AcrR family transcriptional regulator [Streptomyces sp. DG2A-72]MDO0932224.1 TetR/AcrR family transcriptional regulator [Streptomyces sp. DG2A-72]
MGRPREHDEHTARALLKAAEHAIQRDGPEAISIRGVASDVGTTTRAVYSLFGSKQGLVAALAAHAFDLLRTGMEQLPETSAPDDDLIEAGLVIRRFALEHPSLFRIVFRNTADPFMRSQLMVRSASARALDVLKAKMARLAAAGLLGTTGADEATVHFRALCDGLAGLELGGTSAIPADDGERLWRAGLRALVRGLTTP